MNAKSEKSPNAKIIRNAEVRLVSRFSHIPELFILIPIIAFILY